MDAFALSTVRRRQRRGDVSEPIDLGVASLREHVVSRCAPGGAKAIDPDSFLRGMARSDARDGVEPHVVELVPL